MGFRTPGTMELYVDLALQVAAWITLCCVYTDHNLHAALILREGAHMDSNIPISGPRLYISVHVQCCGEM